MRETEHPKYPHWATVRSWILKFRSPMCLAHTHFCLVGAALCVSRKLESDAGYCSRVLNPGTALCDTGIFIRRLNT